MSEKAPFMVFSGTNFEDTLQKKSAPALIAL